MTAAQATEDVINNQIPAVLASNEKGETSAENFDVFCEKGVFELEDSSRLFDKAVKAGFNLNFHGEELCLLGKKYFFVAIFSLTFFHNVLMH
jgi:imidazolonepropionase